VTDEKRKITATDVLRGYKEENLPEFADLSLTDVNELGHFGNRPIHLAAWRGHVAELKALLDAGADVNAVGQQGETPLQEAVTKGHFAAAELLLAHGARRADKNAWGATALDIAKSDQRDDLIALLESAS